MNVKYGTVRTVSVTKWKKRLPVKIIASGTGSV